MRIKITKPGIFGANGEIAVGTELTVKEDPKAWAGRYEVISGASDGKEPVTNPQSPAVSGAGLTVQDKGSGWFVIVDKDGTEVTKSLRRDAVEGFDAKSDDGKMAFVAANKAED